MIGKLYTILFFQQTDYMHGFGDIPFDIPLVVNVLCFFK